MKFEGNANIWKKRGIIKMDHTVLEQELSVPLSKIQMQNGTNPSET